MSARKKAVHNSLEALVFVVFLVFLEWSAAIVVACVFLGHESHVHGGFWRDVHFGFPFRHSTISSCGFAHQPSSIYWYIDLLLGLLLGMYAAKPMTWPTYLVFKRLKKSAVNSPT